MKKTVLVASGIGLLVLGTLTGLQLGRVGEKVDRARAPIASSSQALPNTRTPASASTPAAPLKPPAHVQADLGELPLIEQLPELEARARGGDAESACKLGTALAHCLRMQGRSMPVMSPEDIARQPAAQQEQLAEMTARVTAQYDRLAAACRGIEPETHLSTALHHLLQAANRGNHPARVEFMNFPLGVADVMRNPELGQLYAAQAPRLFQEMWNEGDVAAIAVIALASTPGPGGTQRPAVMAVPPELRNAQLARELRHRMATAGLAAAPPMPPPGAGQPPHDPAISVLAERYWKERFANSASGGAMQSLRSRFEDVMPKLSDTAVFPERCDEL